MQQISRNFSWKTQTLHPLNNSPVFPLSSPWQWKLNFVSMHFATLDNSYKCNNTMSYCDWLISLNTISWKFIHVVAHIRVPFSKNTNTFLKSIYNIPHFLYPFIHQWMFGFLYLLATVNSAAVNMRVQISFGDLALSYFRYKTKSGIAGSYGNSIFNFFFLFWGTSILFSIVAAPIYIPTNSAQGSKFSTSSAILVRAQAAQSLLKRCILHRYVRWSSRWPGI